jgi:hypothetical protein
VVLPGKTIRSTDTGVVLTGDLRVGVSARRWEIAVGWDHILRLTPYYQRYEGEEELPFWGDRDGLGRPAAVITPRPWRSAAPSASRGARSRRRRRR